MSTGRITLARYKRAKKLRENDNKIYHPIELIAKSYGLRNTLMRNMVPDVVFKTRIRDEAIEGDNPYKWKDKTSDEYFKNSKVILFSYLALLLLPVLLISYLILKNYLMSIKYLVLTQSIVCL